MRKNHGDDAPQLPVVFLPRCPTALARFCPWQSDPPAFGPDTLVVQGVHIADDEANPGTPYGLGFNRFDFPFRAYGHDHPRDRNRPGEPRYYDDGSEGRIRAWRFEFNCIGSSPCADLSLPLERSWHADVKLETDPPGQEVFDDTLRTPLIPLDTLCTTSPCSLATIRAMLDFDRFGTYEFILQGQDTEYIGDPCLQPSDLGDDPVLLTVVLFDKGRLTEVARAVVDWHPYSEVRALAPSVPPPQE